MTDPTPAPVLTTEQERRLAGQLFNHVWTLLDRDDRTAADDEEMLHAAHASRWHWGVVGEARHRAIGDWQVSRVYSVLGRPEPALHHARACLEVAQTLDAAWMQASAMEGMARAHLSAGEWSVAGEWALRAAARLAEEPDEEERAVVQADLDSLGL